MLPELKQRLPHSISEEATPLCMPLRTAGLSQLVKIRSGFQFSQHRPWRFAMRASVR